MRSFTFILAVFGVLGGTWQVRAEGRGDEVVVIYNTREPASKDVADHYAQMRHVPARQVMGFPMPNREEINRDEFRDDLQKPIARALANLNLLHFESQTVPGSNGAPQHAQQKVTFAKIRYLVLCYGVPLRIGEDRSLKEAPVETIASELRSNGAAVDTELACLPILNQSFVLTGPYINPCYNCTNVSLLNPTNGLLMVARLDGPNPAIARGLVDKAIEAETEGLWGRAYVDLRGITNGGYKLGEDRIRYAGESCRHVGFETVVDTNWSTFPVSFPMSQIAFYAGWYDENVSGPFTRPTVEFMPGAIAYHLHSFSAATLRIKDRQWAGPLLAKGATATMGCVAEPYLAFTPDIGVFTARFIYSGFTFGEAAYAGQPALSWQSTIIGDPLYRPFATGPQAQYENLVRRHSSLIEWSYLRLVNFKLANGTPLAEASIALENLEVTRHSAVLQEKLAEIFTLQGKPSSSIEALQHALKLDPSPQQRVRLMLTLADHLTALDRNDEAYAVYQQFLKDCPDYPDLSSIRNHIDELGQKLGRTADSKPANRPASPPAKTPPLRHGI